MPITPISLRTGILVAKSESVFGTAETLAAANAGFRVNTPVCKPVGSGIVVPAGTGNGDIGVVPGSYNGDLTFDVGLYAGARRSVLLHSCGFDDTAVTDTFAFTDDTTKWKTMTAGVYYGGNKKDGLFGAMGSLNLRLTPGQIGMASFHFKGAYLANPGTVPTGITWESTLPPVFAKAGALTIGGDAGIACSSFELSSDDNVVLIPSPNSPGTCMNAWLKKPNFRIKVDPVQIASKNWVTDFLASTSSTITAVLNGGTGNTITISATVAHETMPDHADQDEYLTVPLSFAVLNNALSIVFS